MKRNVICKEDHLVNIFQMSERTVRSYFKEAKTESGKYNLVQCMEIYISKNNDEDKEIKKIDKETKKLKLEILEGKYHKVEDVKRIVLDMLANFKSKISTVPISLSEELLINNYIDDDNILNVQENIKNILDTTLIELSEYEYKEINVEDVEE